MAKAADDTIPVVVGLTGAHLGLGGQCVPCVQPPWVNPRGKTPFQGA